MSHSDTDRRIANCQIDTAHLGWSSACAPHKPLREDYDLESPPSLNDVWAGEKSFIWDHKA